MAGVGMAEQFARAGLVATDWTALCPCEHFCFACSSEVCGHCCGGHLHQPSHHPQETVGPVQVERVHGRLAIDANRWRGCGFSLNGIQRIADGDRSYVLLLTVDRHDLRCGGNCQWCQFQIKRNCRWCSIQCKLNDTERGGRREAAERLTALAAQGQFGPPVLLRDRFCFVCRRAYSSVSCPDPVHGHGHGHAAAGPLAAVKTVLRFHGWAAVPVDQLAADFVANVQVLQHPDDGPVVPIQRVAPPPQGLLPALPVNLNLQLGPPLPVPQHQCERPGCEEIFIGHEAFCCFRCRGHQPAAA